MACRLSRYLFILLCGVLLGPQAEAQFFELGLSANYRQTTIDSDNYGQSLSLTGSFSYYFSALSAIEFSYTEGLGQEGFESVIEGSIKTRTTFRLVGADLVLSFAEREQTFQPFIKVGIAHVKKERFLQPEGQFEQRVANQEGTVPSGGIGFRYRLTETLSFKFGLDAWTTPLDEDPVTIDTAGRAGVSWFF
ncbi:MAG: hypothetical protein CL675_11560 [Bdellovibrionaceae bacterium]|nr:hypothetical protein [Pseudobdellovibrionaceae bacterium]